MAGVINTHTFGNRGPGHFCIGVNDPVKSNDHITLAATAVKLPAGTVLGKITGGDYVPLDPAASDGSENFAAILYDDAEINTGTQRATGVTRLQPVNGNALNYVNALTAPQLAAMITAAEAKNIIVRY